MQKRKLNLTLNRETLRELCNDPKKSEEMILQEIVGGSFATRGYDCSQTGHQCCL